MRRADAGSRSLLLLLAQLQQAQSQPRRGASQRSRGSQESGHTTAGRLVPGSPLTPGTLSLVPRHPWGWPGAPCREGDWCQRCFHLLCVIPRALAAGGRSGQGSAQTEVTQGKGWLTLFCCGSDQSAAAAPVPFPPPSPPPQERGEADVVADTLQLCPDLGQGRL